MTIVMGLPFLIMMIVTNYYFHYSDGKYKEPGKLDEISISLIWTDIEKKYIKIIYII